MTGEVARQYSMKVDLYLPIKFEIIRDKDSIVLRASVLIPADSWKRQTLPTDAQLESAMAKAFCAMAIEP